MANKALENLKKVKSAAFKTYMVFYASVALVIYLIKYNKSLHKKYKTMYIVFLILSIIFLGIMYVVSTVAHVAETAAQKLYKATKPFRKLQAARSINQTILPTNQTGDSDIYR